MTLYKTPLYAWNNVILQTPKFQKIFKNSSFHTGGHNKFFTGRKNLFTSGILLTCCTLPMHAVDLILLSNFSKNDMQSKHTRQSCIIINVTTKTLTTIHKWIAEHIAKHDITNKPNINSVQQILVHALRHVRSHVCVSKHVQNTPPPTSEKSPVTTSSLTVQLHMPNRNNVVATATLVTVTFCFHNSVLSCFYPK